MKQTPHTDFSLPELVWHEGFRQWTLLPDEQSDRFWAEWLEQNPGRKHMITEAKAIVRALQDAAPSISPEMASRNTSEIMQAFPSSINSGSFRAPVDTVFKAIEKAYGINIIYDEVSLAKRTFTARLSTETMYEKLDIICRTLNARYEVIDGKIVIYTNE